MRQWFDLTLSISAKWKPAFRQTMNAICKNGPTIPAREYVATFTLVTSKHWPTSYVTVQSSQRVRLSHAVRSYPTSKHALFSRQWTRPWRTRSSARPQVIRYTAILWHCRCLCCPCFDMSGLRSTRLIFSRASARSEYINTRLVNQECHLTVPLSPGHKSDSHGVPKTLRYLSLETGIKLL